MSENTTPETPTPRPRIVSFTPLEDGTLRIDFAAEGVAAVDVDPSAFPEDIIHSAKVEGFISRLRRYGEDGETAEQKRAGILAGIAKLESGVWSLPRGRAGSGEAEFSLTILAAHEYKKAKMAKLGQEYTATVEQTAAELEPILDEYDAVAETVKGKDDKARAEALKETRLAKLKATTLFQAAWAKVKAEKAAKDAAKAAKKAETVEASEAF